MKQVLAKCFGNKNPPTIDGTPSGSGKNLALFQGVIVGLLLLTVFFFALSFLDGEKFHRRFLAEFFENYRPVNALSKDDFAPKYSALMRSLQSAQSEGDVPEIFLQFDEVIISSEQITSAAERAKSNFPFDDFSEEEQRKIDNFYTVLQQMDTGRHQYLLSLKNCLNLSVDGAKNAAEFCDQLNTAWEQKATRLLDDLVATLELSEADKSALKGIF